MTRLKVLEQLQGGEREEGYGWSARQRLNRAHATGAVALAGWVGAIFQSWWVFGIFLALFLALGVWGGSIRLAASRR